MTKDLNNYTLQLTAGGVVIFELIKSLKSLIDQADTQDIEVVKGQSVKRQREQLAWRGIVRKYFQNQSIILSYNEVGAPQIELVSSSEHYHIGVSHSSTHVAVIISPYRCAIDIETLSRDFNRVASRYISPDEAALSSSPDHLALAWSAKEALYKFAGRKQLTLLSDIRLTQLEDGHFEGSITPHHTTHRGVATTLLGHSLVYITA
ncbi:MAG: 4'-phosphopantetheinyl transferase superfamily protein [Rikenellaceae bacterium]